MDISQIIDTRSLSLPLISRSQNSPRLPFCTWTSLGLKHTNNRADKASNDQTRIANFKHLIEFAQNLVKDNKTVPDYTKADHRQDDYAAGDVHSQTDLEDILFDTFHLPKNVVLALICDLGIKERGALAQMMWTLDENLTSSGRTPPCPFHSRELAAEGRQWEYSTLTESGHIDGDRLDKIDREMNAFVENCANDGMLMQYKDVDDLRTLSPNIQKRIFNRLQTNLNHAIGGNCVIHGYKNMAMAGAATIKRANGSGSDIVISNTKKYDLKDMIAVIGHEGCHVSQHKEIGAETTFFGSQITPDQLLEHNNAKSYEKVMMAIAFARNEERNSPRDYRQRRELEREGHVAGMLCSLKMAHHPAFGQTGFLSEIDFQSALHAQRGEDPISIVRQALERKIGFTMCEFTQAASGSMRRLTPAGAEKRSVFNERIWKNLFVMSHHIGDDIRQSRELKSRLEDTLMMGAPGLYGSDDIAGHMLEDTLMMGAPGLFFDTFPEAEFLKFTFQNALSASSPRQFHDWTLAICEELHTTKQLKDVNAAGSEMTDNMQAMETYFEERSFTIEQIIGDVFSISDKLDHLREAFASPLSRFILDEVKKLHRSSEAEFTQYVQNIHRELGIQ